MSEEHGELVEFPTERRRQQVEEDAHVLVEFADGPKWATCHDPMHLWTVTPGYCACGSEWWEGPPAAGGAS